MLQLQLRAERKTLTSVTLLTIFTILVFNTSCTGFKSGISAASATKSYCEQYVEFLGDGFEHGWVEVPEDYENPSSPKLKVFYYRQKNLEGTPVAIFNGGPSNSSHVMFQLMRIHQAKRTEWAKVPLVFIDQRGTGCSTPYPALDEDSVERYMLYASKNIVRDSEVVRKKLFGDQPWKILGQSYGGMIVHRYIMEYPASLVSAHAHGGAIGVDGDEASYRRIKSQHRVMNDYVNRYPEDKLVLAKLGEGLSDSICFPYKSDRVNICGPSIIHQLVMTLGFTDKWMELHIWLADFLTPDDELNRVALQDFVNQNLGPIQEQGSTPEEAIAGRVINFTDYDEKGWTREVCEAIDIRLRLEGKDLEPWKVDECRMILNSERTVEYEKYAQQWENFFTTHKADPIDLESFRDRMDSHGFIGKFYLYSGEFDSFVPVEQYKEEAAELGARVKYHHFSSSGHEGFLEPLVWKNLIR